ncbi:MAG: hypothetical protein IJI14_10410 [Anaerolineaceae bacterium]|nr:hypothetical protein [Anaerolineaceae bacterium]
MGYRSEVAVVLYESDYKKLLKLAEPLKGKAHLDFLENEPKSCTVDGKTYVLLHEDGIKWNSMYAAVNLVEDFIVDKPHAFVRIGENVDDVEVDYRFYEDIDYIFSELIYPCRSIESIYFQINEPKKIYAVFFFTSDRQSRLIGKAGTLEEAHKIMEDDFKKTFCEEHVIEEDSFEEMFEKEKSSFECDILATSAWMNSDLGFDWNIFEL